MSSLLHRGQKVPGDRAPAPAPAGGSAGDPARRRRLQIILTAVTVIAVAAIAAATVVAVRLVTHHPRPVRASVSLRGTAFLLHPGQCFNSAPNGIDRAHAVPCGQPHHSEIYASFSLAGARWPGTAAVASLARAGCQGRLSSYVNPGVAAQGLAEVYLYPNQGAWLAGERHVVCEVRAQQPITGSVRR